MPGMTAQDQIKAASVLLLDFANVHWTAQELLGYLSEGQREYARIKPSAYVKQIDFTLQAGATQKMPPDAAALLDIPRNKSGIRIRQIARRSLDSQVRDWASQSRAKAVVAHFCYDVAKPKSFDVYPPSPGGNVVEMEYYAIPPALTQTADPLVVDESAGPALLDYMLYRAFTKDAEYAANAPRAAVHLQAFYAAASGKAPRLQPQQSGS